MTGTLMGYPNTSVGTVAASTGGIIYDSRFGGFYGVAPGSGSTDGVRKWDSYPNGAELRARNLADLGIASTYFQNACTYISEEIVLNAGAGNSDIQYGLSMFDLTWTSAFGVTSSSLSPSDHGRILSPAQICAFVSFGRDMIATVSLEPSPAEINCIDWGRKYNTQSTITQTYAALGSLPDGSGPVAWILGYNADSTAMQLYSMGLPGSINSVGTLFPATIDATWTNCTGVYGVTVDQTDGNLICGFSTTDSVTHKAYIAKLNANSAAVMWKVAVGTGISYNESDMAKNVVKTGTLYYLGGQTLYTINTATGASTTFNLATATVDATHGHQISEDVFGSIFWYGSWTDGGTAPTYIGAYCGTGGNHSGSAMPWRFWPASYPFVNPPVYGAPAASRKRAWSYVLDGHTFYVLDLGAQGTWLYDITTDQWCQFITQGYIAWNFANGCMWGQRIVAGDLLTTDVWEMVPSAIFDNGATEIIHTVTGGVATRSRIFHSVDSFYLSASNGQALDPVNASVTLEFSDDQGKTWITMDTFSIAAGNYSQEFAWIGLGSFARPGRIFKIIDSGGFLRIDAADAGIDGFDPATADQGAGGGNASQ